MRFTEHEMVFLNSITKGEVVFGIPLHFRTKNGRTVEIEKTIEGLIQKKILKSETELSELGVLPARILELYKQSKTYIIINYLHIALIEGQDAIVIIPLKNKEYELLRLPKVAIVYLLLKQYPVLQGAATGVQAGIKKVDYDSILSQLPSCEGNIMVGAFENNQIISEHVYYWKNDKVRRYDLNSQIEKEICVTEIRREILRLLQVDAEVNKYA